MGESAIRSGPETQTIRSSFITMLNGLKGSECFKARMSSMLITAMIAVTAKARNPSSSYGPGVASAGTDELFPGFRSEFFPNKSPTSKNVM